MEIKRWNGEVKLRELIDMAVMTKPISATVEITDTNIINQIRKSLSTKPSEKALKRNERARDLLRKARRG